MEICYAGISCFENYRFWKNGSEITKCVNDALMYGSYALDRLVHYAGIIDWRLKIDKKAEFLAGKRILHFVSQRCSLNFGHLFDTLQAWIPPFSKILCVLQSDFVGVGGKRSEKSEVLWHNPSTVNLKCHLFLMLQVIWLRFWVPKRSSSITASICNFSPFSTMFFDMYRSVYFPLKRWIRSS